MLLDAAWWQLGALLVACGLLGLVYVLRDRLPWWASSLGGLLIGVAGLLALFIRKAPKSPTAPKQGQGVDVEPSTPQQTKQRPNEALEEIEHEASKLDDVGGAAVRLDTADDELADWRAGAKRDGF